MTSRKCNEAYMLELAHKLDALEPAARSMLAALERLTLYHDKDEDFLESCADYPAVTERTYAQMEEEFWEAARVAIAAARAAGIKTKG